MIEKLTNQYFKNFAATTTPCEFPGCAELREQYAKEHAEAMKTKGCAACKRMGLAQKYKQIIRNRVTVSLS